MSHLVLVPLHPWAALAVGPPEHPAVQLRPATPRRYAVQRQAHAEVLAGFERELEALAAVEVHPAARTAEHRRLVHLVNAPRLREWAAECLACHQHLSDKVNRRRPHS